MRKLFRFIFFSAAVASIVWAVRYKLLPPALPVATSPPAFRRPATPGETNTPADAPLPVGQPTRSITAATPTTEDAPEEPAPAAASASAPVDARTTTDQTPETVAEPTTQAPAEMNHVATGDDLTVIKGIGPVFDERLRRMGITSLKALVAADATRVAEGIDVSQAQVADWIRQARQLVY